MLRENRPGRGRRLLLAATGLLAAGLLVDSLLIEPSRLVPRRLSIRCDGLRARPVRILIFSDLDFLSEGRKERALKGIAGQFRPDLILVAGDFLERGTAAGREPIVESATRFLRSLPSPHGRFLAPGEEEALTAGRLRELLAAEGAIHMLSNESRIIDVGGERIDLFVVDPEAEPAPWTRGEENGRSYVAARGRGRAQTLVFDDGGNALPSNTEFTFAFQALDRGAALDFRFAWREAAGPWGGDGFRLVGNEFFPEITLHSHLPVPHDLEGRRRSGFVAPAGAWCRVRVRLRELDDRTIVQARLWRESAPEPPDWSIEAVDARHVRDWGGTIALGAQTGESRYADLRVEGLDGDVLLEEAFDDFDSVQRRWVSRSALRDWVFQDAPERGVRLLLTHHPDLVLDLAALGGPPPDLVIAGHTHGGLVRIPGLGALYVPARIGRRYSAGLFQYEGIPLHITAGAGSWLFPFRLFNPPEVTLLTLEPPPGEASRP